MNPTEEPVPTPKPQISTAEFQKRQEELEKRARELDRREEELRNAPNNSNVRMNNWPPLPKFCPIQPCFYQDINVDIPVEFQKTVKYLYYLWIGHVTLLLSNFIIGFFVPLSWRCQRICYRKWWYDGIGSCLPFFIYSIGICVLV